LTQEQVLEISVAQNAQIGTHDALSTRTVTASTTVTARPPARSGEAGGGVKSQCRDVTSIASPA